MRYADRFSAQTTQFKEWVAMRSKQNMWVGLMKKTGLYLVGAIIFVALLRAVGLMGGGAANFVATAVILTIAALCGRLVVQGRGERRTS